MVRVNMAAKGGKKTSVSLRKIKSARHSLAITWTLKYGSNIHGSGRIDNSKQNVVVFCTL